MKSQEQEIKDAGYKPVRYSVNKDAEEPVHNLDRDDNNKFVSNMTRALRTLQSQGKKISPRNISIESRYSMKEIELNLYEIENMMNALNIE
jgi:hypothetical protein